MVPSGKFVMDVSRRSYLFAVVVVFLNQNVQCAEEGVLGYGTKFGTDLSDTEEINSAIGLGAPAGFIEGENEEKSLEVYHRYQLYLQLIGEETTPGYDGKTCGEGCPEGSHCSYGVCFCDSGSLTN